MCPVYFSHSTRKLVVIRSSCAPDATKRSCCIANCAHHSRTCRISDATLLEFFGGIFGSIVRDLNAINNSSNYSDYKTQQLKTIKDSHSTEFGHFPYLHRQYSFATLHLHFCVLCQNNQATGLRKHFTLAFTREITFI